MSKRGSGSQWIGDWLAAAADSSWRLDGLEAGAVGGGGGAVVVAFGCVAAVASPEAAVAPPLAASADALGCELVDLLAGGAPKGAWRLLVCLEIIVLDTCLAWHVFLASVRLVLKCTGVT